MAAHSLYQIRLLDERKNGAKNSEVDYFTEMVNMVMCWLAEMNFPRPYSKYTKILSTMHLAVVDAAAIVQDIDPVGMSTNTLCAYFEWFDFNDPAQTDYGMLVKKGLELFRTARYPNSYFDFLEAIDQLKNVGSAIAIKYRGLDSDTEDEAEKKRKEEAVRILIAWMPN